MDKKEAVSFVECLAKGVNPFTKAIIKNDSVLNDVKFVRNSMSLRIT